jgi:3-oxoacyl-[acyl-carrier protein] reductase
MEWNSELAGDMLLGGKVAVVTGAGSGLGQETARILALAGAKVVLADVNEEGLKATAAAIGDDQASRRQVDVSIRAEVEALADWAVTDKGRLDVWVNCAGVGYIHPFLETDEQRAQRVIAVNMMGCYWGCAAAGRVMRSQAGGAIVNISSGGGDNPAPGVAVYGMTKAAVNSLTWTSAAELGAFGVRVNAVAPGWIETAMSSSMYRDANGEADADRREALIAEMKRRSPLGIIGRTSDIAYAVLYLASGASRFVTGQILSVNGGAGM